MDAIFLSISEITLAVWGSIPFPMGIGLMNAVYRMSIERSGGQMTLQGSKRRSDWTKKKSLADSLSREISREMVESVSHLTQSAAARRLGVSGSSICQYRKTYVVPVQKVRTRRDSVRSHRVWEEEALLTSFPFVSSGVLKHREKTYRHR